MHADPSLDPALAGQIERGDADERELAETARELGHVRNPRAVATEIFAALFVACASRSLGAQFDHDMSQIRALLLSTDAAVYVEADKLAARWAARIGHRGTWAPEQRIPYELATAMRRTASLEVARLLPLIVREARWLLGYAGCEVAVVDDIVKGAGR